MAPQALNDDRLGRALEAIAPNLDRIVGSVGCTAIAGFGLDVARMHWDMTSMSLYGGYEQVDEEFPTPGFAPPQAAPPGPRSRCRPASRWPATGRYRCFTPAFNGGAGEVAQVVAVMQAPQRLGGPIRLLMVGDSKLVSYPSLAAMGQAKVAFIAPASKVYVPAEVLAAQRL